MKKPVYWVLVSCGLVKFTDDLKVFVVPSIALMMEAASTPETSVNY
jgi:hypothetical protein